MAEQIGASTELVTGLINIWIALRENIVLDPRKFYEYCQEVKAMFVQEYPDYSLNPATTKVIDHAHLILQKMPESLTVAMLSEVCCL